MFVKQLDLRRKLNVHFKTELLKKSLEGKQAPFCLNILSFPLSMSFFTFTSSCPKRADVSEPKFWVFNACMLGLAVLSFAVVHSRQKQLNQELKDKVDRQLAAGVWSRPSDWRKHDVNHRMMTSQHRAKTVKLW